MDGSLTPAGPPPAPLARATTRRRQFKRLEFEFRGALPRDNEQRAKPGA